jgi:hypothetical protein
MTAFSRLRLSQHFRIFTQVAAQPVRLASAQDPG